MEVLGMCLPYVKRYFKRTSEVLFSLWLKSLRFCWFQECHRDQGSQFQKKKKNAIEVLSMCLAWVKRYFEENQLTAFFFMAQITQILLFSGMPILQRSQFEHIRFFFFF